MAKQLFTGITFLMDRSITPLKFRNISNIDKHNSFIRKTYELAHYTNYYVKDKKDFHSREYHKTKDQLFTYLKQRV